MEDDQARKARVNKLRVLGRKKGLELRETDNGYALVDVHKSHVEIDGRMVDIRLDDVEDYLKRP